MNFLIVFFNQIASNIIGQCVSCLVGVSVQYEMQIKGLLSVYDMIIASGATHSKYVKGYI